MHSNTWFHNRTKPWLTSWSGQLASDNSVRNNKNYEQVLFIISTMIIFKFSYIFSKYVRGKLFFSLIVFGGTEVPIILHFPLPPLRGQPTVKCHPRWQPISGLPSVQSTVGWGDCWIRTQDCSFTIWCCYQWATTAPQWVTTASIMSHHCSLNEPPLLPMSHHCSHR